MSSGQDDRWPTQARRTVFLSTFTISGNYVRYRWHFDDDTQRDGFRKKYLDYAGAEAKGHSVSVAVATGGIFGETVLGQAVSAEKIDLTRFWKWQDSPIPMQQGGMDSTTLGGMQPGAGEEGEAGDPGDPGSGGLDAGGMLEAAGPEIGAVAEDIVPLAAALPNATKLRRVISESERVSRRLRPWVVTNGVNLGSFESVPLLRKAFPFSRGATTPPRKGATRSLCGITFSAGSMGYAE